MDTVTQMLFGAVVAQAGFRRRLGRRAIVAGAVLASVPDFDIAVGWIGDTFTVWQHHRGLTHALIFAPLAGPLLGWLLWRFDRGSRTDPEPGRLRAWIWLAIIVLFTHPLIDLFTSYGTQLLWPFSNTRFAINALPIVDPVYSLILIFAVLVGAFARRGVSLAVNTAATALLLIFAYSLAGWAINTRVEAIAREDFGRPGMVTAYPMLFQPYYRRVVAETGNGAHIGYYSVLNPGPIEWRELAMASGPEVEAVKATREAQIFTWFAMDRVLWLAEPIEGGTRIEGVDLRYGLPGSDFGFWGVRADVTAQGVGPVTAFSRPRDASRQNFARFWAGMTGR